MSAMSFSALTVGGAGGPGFSSWPAAASTGTWWDFYL